MQKALALLLFFSFTGALVHLDDVLRFNEPDYFQDYFSPASYGNIQSGFDSLNYHLPKLAHHRTANERKLPGTSANPCKSIPPSDNHVNIFILKDETGKIVHPGVIFRFSSFQRSLSFVFNNRIWQPPRQV